MTPIGRWRCVFALIVAGSSAGCAAVNSFSASTVQYNLSLEQTQNQILLLNILRASKRRPLAFSEVTTISGQNPASGMLGLSLPLAQNGGTTAATVSPSLSIAGGPTVSMSVVATQDFYEGILKPIPLSTIDLFIKRGISKDLLLNLMIANISVTRENRPTDENGNAAPLEWSFNNYVGDDWQLDKFQRVIRALLNDGLDTEQRSADPDIYGPPLIAADLTAGDTIAKATAAGLKVSQISWCDLNDVERHDLGLRFKVGTPVYKSLDAACKIVSEAEKNNASEDTLTDLNRDVQHIITAAALPSAYYQIQNGGTKDAQWCFDLAGANIVQGGEFCGGIKPPETKLHTTRSATSAFFALPKADKRSKDRKHQPNPLCEALNDGRTAAGLECSSDTWSDGLQISLSPRSTYSVIYYLGELVRQNNFRDVPNSRLKLVRVNRNHRDGSGAPKVEDCKNITQDTSVPVVADNCDILFDVEVATAKANSFLKTRYDGLTYYVPVGQNYDKTYEVTDIATELLALNRTAKDLPTSNVFTLVGH